MYMYLCMYLYPLNIMCVFQHTAGNYTTTLKWLSQAAVKEGFVSLEG